MSPLDTLEDRAAAEREQHEKTVAMVLGAEPDKKQCRSVDDIIAAVGKH